MRYDSKKVIYYLILYTLFALFLCSCKSDSSTEYIKLVSADTRESGEITVSNANNLFCENRIGDIIINSSSSPGPIRYSLYKVVKAKTVVEAQSHFDDIIFESTIHDDSLKCSITAPNNSEYVQYLCGLSLNISNKMPCYIKSPNRGVYTNYMDTTLYVLDSNGSIEIEKHSGSCDVRTSNGDVLVEIFLGNDDFCRCFTPVGGIVLKIPASSSASINAKTGQGSITYTNLIITDLVETEGTLTGKLGSGTSEILLETENGDIELIGFNTM